jgi:hypothetical protein
MRLEKEEELKRKALEQVKPDIFKHTFVDVENEITDDPYNDGTYHGDIMNRPPKDVFAFMNLNFELPSSYYHNFGDFTYANDE